MINTTDILRWLGLRSKKQQYKSRVMKETANVDVSGIARDWDKTKRLYDTLKKRCHPDLYQGEKNEKATKLFQLLMANKYDYEQLLSIKQAAIEQLGISEEMITGEGLEVIDAKAKE